MAPVAAKEGFDAAKVHSDCGGATTKLYLGPDSLSGMRLEAISVQPLQLLHTIPSLHQPTTQLKCGVTD